MTQVFISYSRKDLEFVRRLAEDLMAAGLETWYDLSGLEAGSRWGGEIQKALNNSQYFVVIMSPNSVNSEWVEREFLYASNKKLKVIPLLYQPCDLPMWSLNLHFIDMQDKNYLLNTPELLKILGVKPELAEENPISKHYLKIGDEYRNRGQAAQAIESYQQALMADPSCLKAQTSIGAVFLKEQKYSEASNAFELVLKISAEDAIARDGWLEANQELGNRAQANGKIEEAIQIYLEMLKVAPNDVKTRKKLAGIYKKRSIELLNSGQEEEALKEFRQAMNYSDGDDKSFTQFEELKYQRKKQLVAEWLEKADQHAFKQLWDEATTMVEQAILIDPDNKKLWLRLAEIKDAPRQLKIQSCRDEAEQSIKGSNWEKAISAIQIAIQLSPKDQSLMDRLEWIKKDQQDSKLAPYLQEIAKARAAGDWEQAINTLGQIQKLKPGDTAIQAEIDQLRFEKKDSERKVLVAKAENACQVENWDEVIQTWEQIRILFPNSDPELEEKLAHARKYAGITRDYREAERSIRKKRYGKAIELLQGVLDQDASYRSTSRLLVEAVEANNPNVPGQKSGTLPIKKPHLNSAKKNKAARLELIGDSVAKPSIAPISQEESPVETYHPIKAWFHKKHIWLGAALLLIVGAIILVFWQLGLIPESVQIVRGFTYEDQINLERTQEAIQLDPIYNALRIRNKKFDQTSFAIGEDVRVEYDLVNLSDKTINVPVYTGFSEPDYVVGVIQNYIERLGGDSYIPDDSAARDGDKYAAGGWTIMGNDYKTLPPGKAIHWMTTIHTAGYAKGSYRIYINYQKMDGEVIETVTVDFDLQ